MNNEGLPPTRDFLSAIRNSVTKFFQRFRKAKTSTPSSNTEDTNNRFNAIMGDKISPLPIKLQRIEALQQEVNALPQDIQTKIITAKISEARKVIQHTIDYPINMQKFLTQFKSLTQELVTNDNLNPSDKLEKIHIFKAELKKFQEGYKGNKNGEALVLDKKLAENIYNCSQQILIAARSSSGLSDIKSSTPPPVPPPLSAKQRATIERQEEGQGPRLGCARVT